MATLGQIGYPSFAIALLLLLPDCVIAWTSSALTADLSWPPVGNEGYFTKNGQLLAPNVDPSVFPCASISPPTSAALRVEFPLTGARLQFNFKNDSAQSADYQFIADAYLGQFDSDVDPEKTGWTYLNTYAYNDISSGSQCTDAINVTNEVATAPDFDLQLTSINSQNLVGIDVTLGLRIVLFHGDNNYEEMYQCSYLKLVADNAPIKQQRGICNQGPSSTVSPTTSTVLPTSTATSNPTIINPLPTSTWTPAPTSNPGDGSAVPSPDHHSPNTIGIAVGVSVGAAVLLLVLGFFLLRRRKTKKSKGTLALGFWTAGQSDTTLESGDKKLFHKHVEGDLVEGKKGDKGAVVAVKKADGDGSESDGGSVRGSVHSEPLPVYRKDGGSE